MKFQIDDWKKTNWDRRSPVPNAQNSINVKQCRVITRMIERLREDSILFGGYFDGVSSKKSQIIDAYFPVSWDVIAIRGSVVDLRIRPTLDADDNWVLDKIKKRRLIKDPQLDSHWTMAIRPNARLIFDAGDVDSSPVYFIYPTVVSILACDDYTCTLQLDADVSGMTQSAWSSSSGLPGGVTSYVLQTPWMAFTPTEDQPKYVNFVYPLMAKSAQRCKHICADCSGSIKNIQAGKCHTDKNTDITYYCRNAWKNPSGLSSISHETPCQAADGTVCGSFDGVDSEAIDFGNYTVKYGGERFWTATHYGQWFRTMFTGCSGVTIEERANGIITHGLTTIGFPGLLNAGECPIASKYLKDGNYEQLLYKSDSHYLVGMLTFPKEVGLRVHSVVGSGQYMADSYAYNGGRGLHRYTKVLGTSNQVRIFRIRGKLPEYKYTRSIEAVIYDDQSDCTKIIFKNCVFVWYTGNIRREFRGGGGIGTPLPDHLQLSSTHETVTIWGCSGDEVNYSGVQFGSLYGGIQPGDAIVQNGDVWYVKESLPASQEGGGCSGDVEDLPIRESVKEEFLAVASKFDAVIVHGKFEPTGAGVEIWFQKWKGFL